MTASSITADELQHSMRAVQTNEFIDRHDINRLRGRDILCFSHDWAGDPLSKTHLMRLLARNNRVLWVNSIGYRAPSASRSDLRRAVQKLIATAQPVHEAEPNIFVFNPLTIPAYGLPWIRAFNEHFLTFQIRRAMRKLDFTRPINWVFNPAAGIIAGRLGEESLIYHCVDEYTAFSGVASAALTELEQRLLERADLVVVSAEPLRETKAQHNPRTALVRHGVDYAHFRAAVDARTRVPDDLARLPRPIIGYFGLLAVDWVDVELLARIAERFPHGSLVLIGKVTTDLSKLETLPNVHFFGRMPYNTLPAYCKGFDVGIVPFPISPVTLNANPLKVREYLAAGLPVVSTDIPEVRVLRECRVASDHDGFLRQIAAALIDPCSREQRSATMAQHGWDARLREIEAHFAQCQDVQTRSASITQAI